MAPVIVVTRTLVGLVGMVVCVNQGPRPGPRHRDRATAPGPPLVLTGAWRPPGQAELASAS
ncbi:hypothetical protein RHCRD62_40145 [Rhodococcus sp. RD6.2]|nr:hypothetical protein RHCRD62_40145 [Rhodococcus sp. RD6.2]